MQVWVEDHGPGVQVGSLAWEDGRSGTVRNSIDGPAARGHDFWLMLKTADRVWLLAGPSGTTVVPEMGR